MGFVFLEVGYDRRTWRVTYAPVLWRYHSLFRIGINVLTLFPKNSRKGSNTPDTDFIVRDDFFRKVVKYSVNPSLCVHNLDMMSFCKRPNKLVPIYKNRSFNLVSQGIRIQHRFYRTRSTFEKVCLKICSRSCVDLLLQAKPLLG